MTSSERQLLQMTALAAILVAAICATSIAFFLGEHRQQALGIFTAQALVASDEARDLLSWDDRVALQRRFVGLVRDYSEIRYAFVDRPRESVIGVSNEAAVRARSTSGTANGSPSIVSFRDEKGSVFYDVAVRIEGTDSALRLGLSREEIDLALLPFILTTALFGALAVLAASVLAFFVARLSATGHRLESELRESQDQYQSLVENSQDLIWRIDGAGRLNYLNAAWERTFGYTTEEMLGRAFTDFIASDHSSAGEFPAILYRGESRELELTCIAKTGNEVALLLNSTPVLDETGTPVGAQGIARDVTANKRAELERLRLTTAVEQSVESIVITDASGVIEYVNPAFEATSGFTRSEAVGAKPSIVRSDKHDGAFYRELWETILSGEVWRGQFTNRRRDGTLYDEDATISPVRDETGRIVNFIAVKRDISRERDLEERLREAQRLEAIGVLAGGIAHDFNNILTPILGFAERLLSRLDRDGKNHKDVARIKRASLRARDLVKKILTFSRQSDQGEKLPVRLDPIVDEVITLLRASLPPSIECRESIAADLRPVEVDVAQLHVALLNICLNGAQAMPEGGPLTVSASNVDLEEMAVSETETLSGPFVRIAVTDKGTGMDRQTLTRIFEPFFTTKASGQGTGLGLSAAYGIVRQHGGFLTAQSSLGEGSQFLIYLPAASRSGTESQRNVEEVTAGTERIMVLDDEPEVVQLLAAILSDLGYEVLCETDSRSAIAEFERFPDRVDLLITDLVMPSMGGEEVAAAMHRIRPDLPVIVCTGYDKSLGENPAASEWAVEVAAKPIDFAEVARVVRRALERSRGDGTRAHSETPQSGSASP